ncbi:MAG: histone acetyltransferase 1 [Geoglossum simile]|nr:MAG: histone acetyltransferase 1 [Geoglossum simile]
MAGHVDKWSTDANQAVNISLIQQGASAPEAIATFNPKFTYPIFGKEELIFGYEGLSIHLRFAAHDLLPNLEVTWDQKFKTVGEISALDIAGTLSDWLPQTAFGKTATYLTDVQADKAGEIFKPPGQKIASYKIKNRAFEVWSGKLADLGVQRILERIQIFIPFFIEGGSYLSFDEPEWSLNRWTVFFLYEKLAAKPTPISSIYSFIGYSTAYRYYFYDQDQPQGLKSIPPKAYAKQARFDFTFPSQTSPQYHSRERISQFLILPPFQSQGHGSRFYGALVASFLADPSIKEITVEDPNEAFDDLRDYCDIKRLRENSTFDRININTAVPMPRSGKLPTSSIIDKVLLQELRLRNKIAPRQFDRLVEIQLLSLIPEGSRGACRLNLKRKPNQSTTADKEYDLWRLLVKQRLYKFNRQALMQLDLPERIDKLEEVFRGVESDYVRLLRGLELSEQDDRVVGGENSNGNRGKKRVIEEDGGKEEADETGSGSSGDSEGDEMEGLERPMKRLKAWR